MKNRNVRSQQARRELSSQSIRTLARAAQAKIERGVVGSLPIDEIQNGKDYYPYWKRYQPIGANRLIAFVIVFFSIFVIDRGELGSAVMELSIFFLVIALTYLLESGKRKSEYIKHMLGDLSGLKKEEITIYVDGLLEDLWGIKKEKIVWKIQGIASALFAILIIISSQDDDMRIYYLTLAVFCAMAIFVPKMFKDIKK